MAAWSYSVKPAHGGCSIFPCLPEHRGQGIGGELIRALVQQCVESGAALQLQVLNTNPAQRLYARLGFIKTGEDQIYTQMELRPQTTGQQTTSQK